MATVYLARDLRHDRYVALKVVLPELGAVLGPERFLGEIRVTAHLQHPNLLPLFDSGAADGHLWYTMPYIEGESLRARLLRECQLPVDEAVHLAVAVAGALDYAHRRGVIHRDLKPENILLADREPVVADFGIALAVSKAGGARVTQTGLSLGTPQYMSPEQATGDRTLDGRADVYALGCVLYEMLTGDPPHTGSTAQAVIAKVLTEKPRSIRAARETVPEHVEAAVERALAKLPADRWATAAAFAEALQGRLPSRPASGSGPVFITEPAGPLPARRGTLWARARSLAPWSLAPLLLLLGIGLGTLRGRHSREMAAEPVRFALSTPEAERMVSFVVPLAISPDGRTVVYIGRAGGPAGTALYVRPLGELRARLLPGTDNAQSPFFSPDGRWLGFVVPGRQQSTILRKVPLQGGVVVNLAQFQGLYGASRQGAGIVGAGGAWNDKGVIVVGSERGLFQIPSAGGPARRLTVADTTKGELTHKSPVFLPGGRSVVFGIVAQRDEIKESVAIVSLDDTAYTTILEGGADPIAVVENTLVFGRRDRTLAAVPFDQYGRRVTGEPVPVVDSLVLFGAGNVAAALSQNGSLVYVRGNPLTQLALLDAQGHELGRLDDWRLYDYLRISPDGRRIAVSVGRSVGGADVWVYDLSSKVLSRLTTSERAVRPEWTPDGRRIAYLNTQQVLWDVWWAPADGSGPAKRLYGVPGARISEVTFAPSGDALLRVDDPRTGRDILLLPLKGDSASRALVPLVASPANELQPRVSPDGHWLAYVSDESGAVEVYLRPFPGPGGRVQVSSGGGTEPVWSVDGKRLFYRDGSRFVAASLTTSPGIAVAGRQELFEDRYKTGLFRARYDVHPDGKRFVVLQPPAESEQIIVTLNWLADLRARLSAREPTESP